MSSHPSPINELKLLVTQGSTTYEQVIPDSASGNNSIQITNADILNAFNSQAVGSTFTPSIVTTYATGSFPSGDTLSTPSVVESFIPRVISLADIPNKLTTDASFNLSSLITTVSAGVLSYSSSVTSVATVNSSGQVTPVGAGTTTITVTQAATANHPAGTASKTFTVSLPPPPISRASNNVTIQYTGAAGDVPTSSARFIEANPRGTGDEWFAVVKDGMKGSIVNYATGTSSTPFKRIPGDNSTLVPFNNIVTSLMTDMSYMFRFTTFNQPLNAWDVSNVTTMSFMFDGASQFNQPLNSWNTSSVTDMSVMFRDCTAFNGNVSSWDVSAVINMNNMFERAEAFNQLLNSWDVSSVTNMFSMFTGAASFNQPLNNWDVSAVLNMTYMFGKASSNSPHMTFNQNISGWEVDQVITFNGFRSGSGQLVNINMPQRFLDNGQ